MKYNNKLIISLIIILLSLFRDIIDLTNNVFILLWASFERCNSKLQNLFIKLHLVIYLLFDLNQYNFIIFINNDSYLSINNLMFFLKNKIKYLLDKKQNTYNIVLYWLLQSKVQKIIKIYISFLFLYRVFCNYIASRTQYLFMIALTISIICSRLHIAGYMIILGLFIVRLDTSFRYIAAYYRKNPERLTIDFPQILGLGHHKRFYGKAAQIIIEAAQNPMVQATAVAITGAVVWKALDVLEVTRNTESAAKDREENSRIADKDREENSRIADKNRDAENQRHRESLAAEAKQRELDRESNERIANINSDQSTSSNLTENCTLSSTYENLTLFDVNIFHSILIIFVFSLITILLMKTQLTINYVKYFQLYHIGIFYVAVILYNICMGGYQVAECEPEPLEFKPYIQDPNFILPSKEIKRDSLLQGVYASGYLEKSATMTNIPNYVKPMVDASHHSVTPIPYWSIEYKIKILGGYIISWFSFESWYKWYNQDSLLTQQTTLPVVSDAVVESTEITSSSSITQEKLTEELIIQKEQDAKTLTYTFLTTFGVSNDEFNTMSDTTQSYIIQLARINEKLKLIKDPIQHEDLMIPTKNFSNAVIDMININPELKYAVENNNFILPEMTDLLLQLRKLSRKGCVIAQHFIPIIFCEASLHIDRTEPVGHLYAYILHDVKQGL